MTILERIHAQKEQEVERLLPHRDEFVSRASSAEPPRGFRSTLAASAHHPSLIAEVKKASPSRGVIREDFHPIEMAKQYRDAGADCLSVLTDEKFFQGRLEHLTLCREASGLPCLRKDFMIHPIQVYQARAAGADAILLILALLTPSQVDELGLLARELDMDVLVEVHNEEEAVRTPGWANLVGVNNRSLHDFSEDLAATERLAKGLQQEGRLFVSESSLGSPSDVAQAAKAGARAVLIGTAFCSQPDLSSAVKQVMGW
jgi:indole-3-glycerol phosphate synthase